MTQLQAMTDQQLNRALAELMGWRAGGDPSKERDFVWWIDDHRFRHPEEWDPCNDPAASKEVEKAALAKDTTEYIDNLSIGLIGMCNHRYTPLTVAKMLVAKPRQRAEAAYITMQQVNGQ